MVRRSATVSGARKQRGRKVAKTAARKPRRKSASVAELRALAIENARLSNETKESLQQQIATAEVLQIISDSPGELQPVFEAVLQKATRICDARFGSLLRFDGNSFYFAADVGTPEALREYMRRPGPFRGLAGGMIDRIHRTRQVQHSADYAAEAAPGLAAKLGGARSTLGVPILREDELVGAIVIYRQEVRPFSEREIDLVRSFASQAAIAIENARLFNETKQALERQSATADILKVIARSPNDAQPVFDALVTTARRLLHRELAFIILRSEDTFHPVAIAGPQGLVSIQNPIPVSIDPDANFPSRVIVSKQSQQFADWSAIDLPEQEQKIRELYGINSALYLPMLRGDDCIGVLGLGGSEPGVFSEADIALAQSFCDQALIAIDNTRLFDEVQAKTRDLEESLQQQTATADVLRIISRSVAHAAPVFDTILESCQRLFKPYDAAVYLVEGDRVRGVARRGRGTGDWGTDSMPLEGSSTGLAIARRQAIHFPDLADKAELPEDKRAQIREIGGMTVLYAPMISQESGVGSLVVTRQPKNPFTNAEIGLIQTFADQAVIAIENARLFEEVQAKTRDLSEALEQQTATSDVLAVISRSPSDLNPVLEAISDTAARLCGSEQTMFFRYDGAVFRILASWNFPPDVHEMLQRRPLMPGHPSAIGRAGASLKPVCIPDVLTDPHYGLTGEQSRARYRATLAVPLLRDGQLIGALSLNRSVPGAFTEKQIELVTTFADQAVIAIENARLFNETREALERQTATSDILRVISQSPTDVQPVFEAIAQTAVRLLGCDRAFIQRCNDESFWTVSWCGPDGQMPILNSSPVPIDPAANFPSRAIIGKRTLHLPDWSAIELPEFERAIQDRLGIRSALYLPLLRNDECIGLLAMAGTRANAFAAKDILLAESFRDQALIAIENTRLFDEVQAKTRDLTEALAYQTGSGNVLRVIASSPTDIGPVLETIVESARELCEADDAVVLLKEGESLRFSAHSGPIVSMVGRRPISRQWTAGRAFVDQKPVHVHDMLSEEGAEFPDARAMGQATGASIRTVLSVPLLRGNESIGAILLRRTEVRPFKDKQIELLSTFADQAVIAIQNARLFNETREALEQQKASADILNVISNSVAETKPVFEEILQSMARLFGSQENFIFLVGEDNLLHVGAGSAPRADEARALFPAPLEGTVSQIAIRDRRIVISANVFEDPELPSSARERYRRLGDNYAMAVVPMLWEERAIGSIMVARTSMQPFSEKECSLLRTFADQAVIAIQNARQFNETKEALERQTATSDILNVIASSPTDTRPVFEAIASRAKSLVGGFSSTVFRFIDGQAHLEAFTPTTHEADEVLTSTFPSPAADFAPFLMAQSGEVTQIADIEARTDQIRDIARARGFRSMLFAPLMNKGVSIGLIVVTRVEPGQFAEDHVQLLRTFADQAVIAIENVRLFDEVQAKTRDLEEALQQQTATADVLRVISRSTFDLQVVLNTLVQSAVALCDATACAIYVRSGDSFHAKAVVGENEEFIRYLKSHPQMPGRGSVGSRVLLTGEVQNIADVRLDDDYEPALKLTMKARAALGVPLKRDGTIVGAIVLARSRPEVFNQRQIELTQTYADQAVIAIENVRLFESVEARTRELAKSLEDLRTAQDRLVQTEKLASLGQLTAGIAHEIKNPLNFVNNFSALSTELTDELKDVLAGENLTEPGREQVDEITGLLKDNLGKVVQHGKRADSIVKNMLQHSREGSGERRSQDLNALVSESLNLAYHGARAERSDFNITLEQDLDPDAGAVEVYPQDITRALLNLFSNGFYAAISRKKEADGTAFEPVLSTATRRAGNTVEIRIRDNGTGIPAEIREKIFNPFFTTKPTGEGTGLGLSMTHDIIVKQHGGRIDLHTEAGAFTEFTITLPRANGGTKRT